MGRWGSYVTIGLIPLLLLYTGSAAAAIGVRAPCMRTVSASHKDHRWVLAGDPMSDLHCAFWLLLYRALGIYRAVRVRVRARVSRGVSAGVHREARPGIVAGSSSSPRPAQSPASLTPCPLPAYPLGRPDTEDASVGAATSGGGLHLHEHRRWQQRPVQNRLPEKPR